MKKYKSLSDNKESGVSEAIGFIIMFSIVLTGIAMVTLYAYPVLLQSQINSDERTMEQTMISLQNEMKLLTYSNVPYRDIAVRVAGGTLDAKDSTKSKDEFILSYPNAGLSATESKSLKPGEIRFTSKEGTAVYTIENGALLSREKFQPGSSMIARPRWYFDDSTQTLVILLTKISADKDYYLSNIGNIQMSMLNAPQTVDINYVALGHSTQDVTLTYTPDPDNDLSTAWENYLTGDSFSGNRKFEKTATVNEYKFSGVSRIVIKEYTIKIEDL